MINYPSGNSVVVLQWWCIDEPPDGMVRASCLMFGCGDCMLKGNEVCGQGARGERQDAKWWQWLGPRVVDLVAQQSHQVKVTSKENERETNGSRLQSSFIVYI